LKIHHFIMNTRKVLQQLLVDALALLRLALVDQTQLLLLIDMLQAILLASSTLVDGKDMALALISCCKSSNNAAVGR
jgi:hypothetical protein